MFKKYHKRGYTIDNRGYIHLWMPNHPFTDNKGYIKQANYVMEQYLGRYLKSQEIVHHINQIKNDDRIENLKLFANDKKHMAKGNHKIWNKGKHTGIISKSVFKKGHKTWNKDKKIQTNTGRTHFKKGQIPWNKGKKLNFIPKMAFKKGQIPWNKGIPCSKETKRKISITKRKNLH